jgi:hypothetical protein
MQSWKIIERVLILDKIQYRKGTTAKKKVASELNTKKMADDLLVDGTQKEIQYICTIQSKIGFKPH